MRMFETPRLIFRYFLRQDAEAEQLRNRAATSAARIRTRNCNSLFRLGQARVCSRSNLWRGAPRERAIPKVLAKAGFTYLEGESDPAESILYVK